MSNEITVTEDANTASRQVESQPEVSPLAQILAQGNHDIGTIERLWEIQKEWEASQARKAYFAAMAKAREELPRIVKDRRNTHLGNDYASLDAMIAGGSPVLGKYELSFMFRYDITTVPGFNLVTCQCTHALGYSDEVTVPMPVVEPLRSREGRQVTNVAQTACITMTYGQRRAFAALFGIATGDDEDGQVVAGNKGAKAPVETLTDDEMKELDNKLGQAEKLVPGTEGRWKELYQRRYKRADNLIGLLIPRSDYSTLTEEVNKKIKIATYAAEKQQTESTEE